jgi:hypothetical protein
MAFDFPNSPTPGQTYPSPAIAGTPVYTWDGFEWTCPITQVPPTGSIPLGTVMLFWQAAPPVNWTQITTQNDKALRVVSGVGGVSGGSNPFSTVQAQTVVGNHTLAASEIPTINSSGGNTINVYPAGTSGIYMPYTNGNYWSYSDGFWYSGSFEAAINSAMTGIGNMNSWQGGNVINVGSTNTGSGAHNHTITMSVQYCDVIIASRTS